MEKKSFFAGLGIGAVITATLSMIAYTDMKHQRLQLTEQTQEQREALRSVQQEATSLKEKLSKHQQSQQLIEQQLTATSNNQQEQEQALQTTKKTLELTKKTLTLFGEAGTALQEATTQGKNNIMHQGVFYLGTPEGAITHIPAEHPTIRALIGRGQPRNKWKEADLTEKLKEGITFGDYLIKTFRTSWAGIDISTFKIQGENTGRKGTAVDLGHLYDITGTEYQGRPIMTALLMDNFTAQLPADLQRKIYNINFTTAKELQEQKTLINTWKDEQGKEHEGPAPQYGLVLAVFPDGDGVIGVLPEITSTLDSNGESLEPGETSLWEKLYANKEFPTEAHQTPLKPVIKLPQKLISLMPIERTANLEQVIINGNTLTATIRFTGKQHETGIIGEFAEKSGYGRKTGITTATYTVNLDELLQGYTPKLLE